MHWNRDKYQATKGSALKEQVMPTLVLFPELVNEIAKILAEKERAVVYSKHNDAKMIIPRYGEQAEHMNGILSTETLKKHIGSRTESEKFWTDSSGQTEPYLTTNSEGKGIPSENRPN